MTIHIGAKPGDMWNSSHAGRPLSREMGGETFLKDANFVDEVRAC